MKREIKSEKLQEIVKKSKSSLIIWSIVILCSFVLIGLGYYYDLSVKKESTYFNDVLMDENAKEGMTVFLDVYEKPYDCVFYTGENLETYYFVWDEKYMYIAYINKNDLDAYNIEDISSHPVKMYGVTKKIPYHIKKSALETYNENVSLEEQIEMSEFESYFGNYYIDTTEYSLFVAGLYVFSFLVFFVGLIGLLTRVIVRVRLTRRIKKISDDDWEILNRELEDTEAFYYKNAKICLTKSYIVDFASGFKMIAYADILWLYNQELRQNGIKTQRSVILYTKDKKRHVIASLDGFTKKSKMVSDEIVETIASKNSKILFGYTKENRQKMKEDYQIKA